MVHLKSFTANNNNTKNIRKRKQKLQMNELNFQLTKSIGKVNESKKRERKKKKESGRTKKKGRRAGGWEREGGKKDRRKMIKKKRPEIK